MKISCLLTSIATMILASTAMAYPTIYPTGTTIYDKDRAYNGYILISEETVGLFEKADARGAFPKIPKDVYNSGMSADALGEYIYLIDMNGNLVNKWKDVGSNKKAYLLPNGHLLSISEHQSAVIEYDWDGKEVWRYATKLGVHHDGRRLENGNTLILCYEEVPQERNKDVFDQTTQWWGKQERKSVKLRGDTIIEVNPEGKIVWSWNSSEHLDLNRYMPLQKMRDWTHGNTCSIIPPNKWYDAGDKRFKPGNILYNPRHFDECVIIDKESGEIVWSLANFTPLGGLGNAHEPVMIEKGLPGEGNILIFDNGLFARSDAHAAQSVVWEINPTNNEVVWRYMPSPQGNAKFLSKYMGSAYKLPNGNVLISEDFTGRVFQVKPDATHPDGGEIVWEYVFNSKVARTSMYPYDFTSQLKALPKPKEMNVSPLNPGEWHVLPDEMRKGDVVLKKGALF